MMIQYEVAPGGSAWARSTATIEIDDLPKAIRETERELRAALKRVSRLSETLGKTDFANTTAKARATMRVNLDLACAHRDTMTNRLDALKAALPHPVADQGLE